jgi:hypothetical protein
MPNNLFRSRHILERRETEFRCPRGVNAAVSGKIPGSVKNGAFP